MSIKYDDTNHLFRLITISGRLDIPGTGEIEQQFAALAAAEKRNVVVDLTGITFLASIGIRALISNAKTKHLRGGKMALLVGENDAVAKTLTMTGIDALIPLIAQLAEAPRVFD
jgi:anti-anti-sigma factor